METVLAKIHTRFEQDLADRQLYGADVVDAYLDIAWITRRVTARLPHLHGTRFHRLVYAVLKAVDTEGMHG